MNGGGFTLQSLAQAGIDFSNLTTQVFVANVSEFDECINTLESHCNAGFGGVRSETSVIFRVLGIRRIGRVEPVLYCEQIRACTML